MSMADRDGFIWYDGAVPWHEATTHVLTHTALAGRPGAPLLSDGRGPPDLPPRDHTDRLFRSAQISV